jgi:hypothetical protein
MIILIKFLYFSFVISGINTNINENNIDNNVDNFIIRKCYFIVSILL